MLIPSGRVPGELGRYTANTTSFLIPSIDATVTDMIDSALKLIDRLLQLVKVREDNRAKRFKNIIEPMYQDAQSIMDDYNALFKELITKLETEEDVAPIIQWLETRRLEMVPVRIKTRAFLGTLRFRENELDKFNKGIWGLMKGGITITEEGHVPMQEYGWGDHTVLDLLYMWSDRPVAVERERYIQHAKEQLAAIQRAWQDVNEGYAELKQEL